MGNPLPNGDAADLGAIRPSPSGRSGPVSRGRCIHCGLELGASVSEELGPFCCAGCKTVYGLIHDSGLDRYYDLRPSVTAPPAALRPDNFAWLDVQLQDPANRVGEGLVRLRLDLQGVHCAACVWLLEQLFRRRPGGRSLVINPALGTVDLMWDTRLGDLVDYLADAERFGYRFGPSRKGFERRSRGLLARLAVAVAAAMNVMVFSLSYYFGLGPDESGPAYRLFGWLSFALCTLTVAVGGWPFLAAAVRGLRRRVAHLDLPIALGMLLGWAGSVYGFLTVGPEAAYFDTVTLFTALMLVGRWLQEFVLERNRNALLASGGIADLYARRFQDGRLTAVSAAELDSGDELWIAPGDLVPVDGVLLQREARISLDWITGESAPEGRAPGEKVPAGAFNAGETGFRLAAVEPFSDSRLHELIRGGGDGRHAGEQPRGPWHRVASVYVASVLTLAAAGFLFWIGRGSRHAVEVAVSVLVVTCPCALGLAVPLAKELVHVGLRRRGVLLRNEGYLERALRIRKILFDKTGTLTRGQLVLTDASRRALLSLTPAHRYALWSMTSRSNHPVSRCTAAAAGLRDAASPSGGAVGLAPGGDGVVEKAGAGLRWRTAAGEYRFGRPDFAAPGTSAAQSGAGRSLFALDGEPLVMLSFSEELKSDAIDEIARLGAQGYAVHVLSGDDPERVRETAARLGLRPDAVSGGLDPEEKAARVRELDDDDTLMVGDGLNDSPSFDVAWAAATPAVDRAVLSQKSDFYYLGDGVAAVRRTLQAAHHLRRVQRDNLIFAATYNLVAVGLCLAGVVNPVVAAVMMPVSSVTVVAITTTRLGRGGARWMS